MTEGKNDNVNQSMRQMLGKSQAVQQPLGTPPAQDAQEGTSAAPQAAQPPSMGDSMRGLLAARHEAQRPDPAWPAFEAAARAAGMKNPALTYGAIRDGIVINLTGDVLGLDALLADLKAAQPGLFWRVNIDAGAGIGDATGEARTPNPAQGSDLARTSLDIRRRFRQD